MSAQMSGINLSGNAAAGEQYLTFMLNGEEYGVDILRVQEIKGWEAATEIPNTPSYVLGVINLRGAIMPVIDLRLRFGFESAEYTDTTVVIVLKVRNEQAIERTMGFVVDAVSDVYNISTSQLQAAPQFGGRVRTDYVKGLAMVDDKMVILMDIDHLVDSDAEFSEGADEIEVTTAVAA
jgi:purine-binding chemotaxis protein CheW